MSKLVREYLRDTIKEVRDDISFSYARESDFNAIKNKRFPAVLLLPLIFDSERSSGSVGRTFHTTMLFYDLDKLQGTEQQTQDILDKTEDLLLKFQAKVNIRSLTVDDDPEVKVTSEKIEISNERVKERIKFTSDCVTGWEYTFDMLVPDQLDYCDVYD